MYLTIGKFLSDVILYNLIAILMMFAIMTVSVSDWKMSGVESRFHLPDSHGPVEDPPDPALIIFGDEESVDLDVDRDRNLPLRL